MSRFLRHAIGRTTRQWETSVTLHVRATRLYQNSLDLDNGENKAKNPQGETTDVEREEKIDPAFPLRLTLARGDRMAKKTKQRKGKETFQHQYISCVGNSSISTERSRPNALNVDVQARRNEIPFLFSAFALSARKNIVAFFRSIHFD